MNKVAGFFVFSQTGYFRLGKGERVPRSVRALTKARNRRKEIVKYEKNPITDYIYDLANLIFSLLYLVDGIFSIIIPLFH